VKRHRHLRLIQQVVIYVAYKAAGRLLCLLTYSMFAQMELWCSLERCWEAAEVKMHKCIPFGIGGAIEEWGADLDLLRGWRGAFLKTLVASSTFLAGFGESYMAGHHEAGRPAGWDPNADGLGAADAAACLRRPTTAR
jgi:hypothetical protein